MHLNRRKRLRGPHQTSSNLCCQQYTVTNLYIYLSRRGVFKLYGERLLLKVIVSCSVTDPFHFDTAPDPRIRFVEKRIQVRPKIVKIPTFA